MCLSVQFSKEDGSGFGFGENGSGGSGSAFGFGKNGSDGSGSGSVSGPPCFQRVAEIFQSFSEVLPETLSPVAPNRVAP